MSGDLLLILDRRDLFVCMEGNGALRVEHPDGSAERFPLGVLGMVAVYGRPAITCDVWRNLAERNIPAVLLPARGKGDTAWLGNGLSNAIAFRRRQHRIAQHPEVAMTVARHLVGLKLRYQRQLVQQCFANSEATAASLLAVFDELTAALPSAADGATLMGVEGAAAAAWYGRLARHLPSTWGFCGRNRRPPRDPVNAMLSLGYTLLGGEMQAAVQAAGLDPALGFVHGIVPGRESLVLDLIEPLRAGVDALVLQLIDGKLTPEQFTQHAEHGCRLGKDGRAVFFEGWAQARRQWPLPIAADTALLLESDEPELHTADDELSVADTGLRTQCRRVVRILRVLLRKAEQTLDDTAPPGDEAADG